MLYKENFYTGTGQLTGYETYEYNASGQKSKESCYDASGQPTNGYTYEYNASGQESNVSWYDASGHLSMSQTFEYNSSGQKSKESSYDASGQLSGHVTYEYNASGQESKYSNYDASGQLSSYGTEEYNVSGQLSKDSHYDASGQLSYYGIEEHNVSGQLSKDSHYDASGQLTGYDIYEYNASGQESKFSFYNAAGQLSIYATYEYDNTPASTAPITSTTPQAVLAPPSVNAALSGSGLDVIDMGTELSTAYNLTSNHDGSFNLTTTGSANRIDGVIQVQFADKTMNIAKTDSLNEQVALLYQGALGRTPDSGGLAFWDRTAAGLPATAQALGVYGLSDAPGNYNGNLSIAGGFTQSAEFINKYGSLTNTQFATQLYANILDRTPDSGGLAYWQSQLDSGGSREHVLVGFAESTEAINNATAGYVGQSGAHAAWLMLT